MRITELDLSPAARLCLEVADIYEVHRLLEHGTGRLIHAPSSAKAWSCMKSSASCTVAA